MTPVELAWLSGILEGEGYFHSRAQGTDSHGRSYLYPAITLGMTDEDVVARVAALFGVTFKVAQVTKGNKNFYRCVISGSRAAALMQELLPHMGRRRSERIGVILADYESRDRNGSTRIKNTWAVRRSKEVSL